MDTPIYDFVKKYSESNISRFHMPGHKGCSFLGCENIDITEIEGADVLSMADGIIAKSQMNASHLFGSGATYYSAEGSSLCIKAMLMSVMQENNAKGNGRKHILAARNVHRAMIDACALIGLDVTFITSGAGCNICAGGINAEDIKRYLEQSDSENYPIAVYVTSPDYLGNIADIKGISSVCEKYMIPLVVDNAHGAYLAFLEEETHPIKLGAAMCCDSAHKTLPVLTGGAYLHIAEGYKERYAKAAERCFSLFASTSPSYLILQSLDLCNAYLSENYSERLRNCIKEINLVKQYMRDKNLHVMDTEPLKIVIDTAKSGYTGSLISSEMRKFHIECEYSDRQFVVLMVSPENSSQDFQNLITWCEHSCLREEKDELALREVYTGVPKRRMSIREAVFAPSEMVDAEDSYGRICAAETISCPPAVPVAISGEVIDENMIMLFKGYNINKVCVCVL